MKNEVYVPSGKNIINDSPWPPDFEPTVKEMRHKLYEFGAKREGLDEPPREEMRKLRQYYAVKFRSWLKDGNRDMSQLLCHYYAVAKMSNRCWERAVSIMEKYRLASLSYIYVCELQVSLTKLYICMRTCWANPTFLRATCWLRLDTMLDGVC